MPEGQTPSFSSNLADTETIGYWSETSEDGSIFSPEGQTSSFSPNQKETFSDDGSSFSVEIDAPLEQTTEHTNTRVSELAPNQKETFKINGSSFSVAIDAPLEQTTERSNTMISELEMPSFSSLMFSERSKIGKKYPSKDKEDEICDSTDTARSLVEFNVPPDPPQSLAQVQGLDEVREHIDIMRGWIKNVHEASLLLRPSSSYKQKIPIDVGVTHEFEHSLNCLTSYHEKAFQRHQSDLNLLVQHISRIPGLLSTIMLIEDDTDRKRILSYPIVKCAMMNKYSLMRQIAGNSDISRSIKGSWLIDLMEFGKSPLRKVIEYLEIISNITAMDLVPNNLKSTEKPLSLSESRVIFEHKIKFFEQRRELYTAFTKMSHFIPTLLLLSDSQMEDVAGIGVIKYAVEWNLYQPIGVSLVFLDIVSHIIIVISMRLTANVWVKAALNDLTKDSSWAIVLFLFATLGVVYWFSRRLCEAISIISISPKAYLKHFASFWNLLDLTALLLSVFLYIVTSMTFFVNMRKRFSSFERWFLNQWFTLLSILVLMLWINLLGLFKVLNKKLATMVLAISKIIKDIRILLVVVAFSILASGDMLGIYLSTNFQVCPENSPHATNSTEEENTSVFCSKKRGASFMAIYNMFIGNVSFDDFSGTWLTTFVFVGLTFYGIIILLNVIIALVSNSYNESNKKSEKLYGKARLSYVATLIAYEDLIKPKSLRDLSGKDLFLQLFVQLIKITIMLISLGILISMNWVIYSTMTHGAKWIVGLLATPPVLLTWFILCSYQITGWDRTDDKFKMLRQFQNNKFISLFSRPLMYVTRMVLGTNEFNNTSEFNLGNNLEFLEEANSPNGYHNENINSEFFEDYVKKSLSMIKKQHAKHHEEMKDMKKEMKCLKDGLEEIKEMMRKNFEEK